MTSLEDYPQTWETPDAEEARQSWRIEHDAQMDWALLKLAEARRRDVKTKTRAQAHVDRIRNWEQDELERNSRDVSFFEGILTDYAMRARAEGRKTLDGPYGSVSTSGPGQGSWEVDEAELIPYLKQRRPDLVTVKESVDKGVLKREFKGGADPETGEALPGVTVIPGSVSASIKVDLKFDADREGDR